MKYHDECSSGAVRNPLIPVVQMAHEVYTLAHTNSLTKREALQMARVVADSHVISGPTPRSHYFSDEEIKTGICLCKGCTDLREKSIRARTPGRSRR